MSKRKAFDVFAKHMSEKRKGKNKKSAPRSIMVQRMMPEPNHLKKFEAIETREFVDYTDYDEITIENIKSACENYFSMPQGSCDILLGDRGPSCYLTEQIIGKKLYFIRFVDPATLKFKPPRPAYGSSSHEHKSNSKQFNASMQKPHTSDSPMTSSLVDMIGKPTSSKPKKIAKSISVSDLLSARKLIEPKASEKVTLQLETFDIAIKQWSMNPVAVTINKERDSFAEGGFRHAFIGHLLTSNENLPRKVVIKTMKPDKAEAIEKTTGLNEVNHTRKLVQMHNVAKSIAEKMREKAPWNFKETFSYNDTYYVDLNGSPATVEGYIHGKFEKYSNNDGQVNECILDKEIMNKAECFMHFSHKITNGQLMIVDLQGVGYQLCDPEIATTVLEENGSLNFCAGNLADLAINNFFDNHICNPFCKMLNL